MSITSYRLNLNHAVSWRSWIHPLMLHQGSPVVGVSYADIVDAYTKGELWSLSRVRTSVNINENNNPVKGMIERIANRSFSADFW